MRVCINGRFLTQPVSGVQRYAREMVGAIDDLIETRDDSAAGMQVELVAPARGLRDVPPLRHVGLRTAGRLGGHAWEQIELPRHARGSVLFCPGNTAPIRSLRGGPVVVTVHDLSYRYFPEAYGLAFRSAYRVLIPQVLRRAAAVITVSESERASIAARYPGVADGIVAIQNGGLSRDRIPGPASRREEGSLLYVGALNRRKNPQGVIRAFEILARDRDVALVIVGGGGAAFRRLDAPIGAAALERVRFRGQVDEVDELVRLYRRASCLVFPSFYEASPLPPLEAMACGCPVVASRIPALEERCGDAVHYCDPDDARDIAARVAEVLDDDGLAATLRARGLERARSMTWKNCARRTLEVIRSAAVYSSR